MSYHKTPLKYGSKIVDDFIPEEIADVSILEADEYTPDFTDFQIKMNEVLARPLGSKPFDILVKEVYSKGEIITIIVDDNTRPNIHTRALLPHVIRRLLANGVDENDIRVMLATGTHKAPTPEQIEERVLGSKFYANWKDRVLVHDSDSGNRHLGETSRGTPIYIDQRILDSCLVIPLSDSEYHYFAGQAGTVKLFCPGVAGRETIRVNHPRMFDIERGFIPGCRLGNIDGNEVIQDMIEVATECKERLPMFCIDTIVNDGEIVYVQAGDLIECHKAAAEPLRRLRVVDVEHGADIVFVSVGELGLNLYQAGKGIHAAWNALRHDMQGWIVLMAPCQDGIGSAGYAESMLAVKDMPVKEALRYVIETYCSVKTFKIGNQKPPDLFRILLDVAERDIKVVTELDPVEMSSIYRMEAHNPGGLYDEKRILRELVQRYIEEKGNPNPRIYVLPDAGLLVNVKHQQH
ncbi:MAG: lactate racemase domain-containing protein [Candidatus Thorarchaeota archaeon]